MESQTLSLQLTPGQVERLRRLAHRLDTRPSDLAARLIEEALRMAEFPHIEFRDSVLGRQAYIAGHRLTVWMLVWLTRKHDDDPARTAEYLGWPSWLVEAGLAYYQSFTAEIDPAIREHEACDLGTLRRVLPNTKVITIALRDEADPLAVTDTTPVQARQDAQAAAR